MSCLKKLRVKSLLFIDKKFSYLILFVLFTIHYSLFTPAPARADWGFDALPPICNITAPSTVSVGSIVYVVATATSTDSLSLISNVTLAKSRNGAVPPTILNNTESYLDPLTTPSSPRMRVYSWNTSGLTIGDVYTFTAGANDTSGNSIITCSTKQITLTPGPTTIPGPPPSGIPTPIVTTIPPTPTGWVPFTPTPTGYYPAHLDIQGGDVHVHK